jgi:hypothetical protein
MKNNFFQVKKLLIVQRRAMKFAGTTKMIIKFVVCTDKKVNEIFLLYEEIQMGAVAKPVEELPNIIRKYANILPYRRRPSVIYATAPSEFPYL